MLTLVRPQTSNRARFDSAPLVADYLAFDRQRRSRRQYMKAFGGMAVIVLLGAAFGRVPTDEAWIVAGLLAAVPLSFATAEAFKWHRLIRRLNHLRVQTQDVRKL